MSSGICVCVLLAVLSSSVLGHQSGRVQDESMSEPITRARLLSPSNERTLEAERQKEEQQQKNVQSGLRELLSRLMSRRVASRRNSSLSSSHRIKDRDYMGWMDFGRRSAEEYEYSS